MSYLVMISDRIGQQSKNKLTKLATLQTLMLFFLEVLAQNVWEGNMTTEGENSTLKTSLPGPWISHALKNYVFMLTKVRIFLREYWAINPSL